jgi:hypothetical protein
MNLGRKQFERSAEFIPLQLDSHRSAIEMCEGLAGSKQNKIRAALIVSMRVIGRIVNALSS